MFWGKRVNERKDKNNRASGAIDELRSGRERCGSDEGKDNR